MEKNLVSLIAPFYNGEKYLERFLKSVLSQTYYNVQFILVNDGSTDNSYDIVKKFEDELDKKFSEFIYLEQENGGAASAVNYALKYVKGEYLCWADCDDELLPDNIYLKLNFLNNHREYGMVNCGAIAIDECSGNKINSLIISDENRFNNMFKQIIDGIPVYPGVFMIRTQLLFNVLENRTIYFNREAGQNYQLLLPVAYFNKCGFIDEILYKYYIRLDSHSHDVDYERAYKRTYVREELLDNVLSFMEENEKKCLMEKIKTECCNERLNMAFHQNDKEKTNEAYKELIKNKYSIFFKNRVKHWIINVRIVNSIYRMKGKNK